MKGVCNVCGCTDNDCSQCVEASGHPCFWIDDTEEICSRCYADEFFKEDSQYQNQENILDISCPNCKRQYDAIDIDYQICHHCNFNNNKK